MNFGEAYDYLKDMGFTFQFEHPDSIRFSDCHVFYGKELFGTMYQHNMMFGDGKGMVRQFTYDGWWPRQEFFDYVKDYLIQVKQNQVDELIEKANEDFR
jgi:hypothetical protein